MMCLYVSSDGGKTYQAMGKISEISIETEPENETENFFNTEPMEFSCELDEKSVKNIEKVLYTKGQRNGRILKRDGFLSPENADKE